MHEGRKRKSRRIKIKQKYKKGVNCYHSRENLTKQSSITSRIIKRKEFVKTRIIRTKAQFTANNHKISFHCMTNKNSLNSSTNSRNISNICLTKNTKINHTQTITRITEQAITIRIKVTIKLITITMDMKIKVLPIIIIIRVEETMKKTSLTFTICAAINKIQINSGMNSLFKRNNKRKMNKIINKHLIAKTLIIMIVTITNQIIQPIK